MSSRLLLVFGLRGTLLERIHTSKAAPTLPTPHHSVGMSKVWQRPHMLDSLTKLSEKCDLAIWSSTTTRNTAPLMDAVFQNAPFSFKFVWSREHTKSDDIRRLMAASRDDEHATLKDLSFVTSAFPQYSLDRIVLVDDTPSKARLQADNFLWVTTFDENNLRSDNGMESLVEAVNSKLVGCSDVRKILPLQI